MSEDTGVFDRYKELSERVKNEGMDFMFEKPSLKPQGWIDIKTTPPTNEDSLHAFTCFLKNRVAMIGDVMTLKSAKECRSYQLKNEWTHYIELPNL